MLRSGIDKLKFEPHLQPRFYVIMTCLPNRGKTAANNETRTAINSIFEMVKTSQSLGRIVGNFETVASADSGPFLVEKFHDLIEDNKKLVTKGITSDDAGRILLDPDEMSDVFEKARTSTNRVSTLFGELLKLHSGNRTGNGTRRTGDLPVDKAHLAVYGGTTLEKYRTLWTGTGAGGDGLMSRFITIGTNADPVPPVPLSTDGQGMFKAYQRLAKLLLMPGQEIVFDPTATKMLTDWWGSIDTKKKETTRVLETVKQLLIVLAVTNAPEEHNGTTLTVGQDLMSQAIQFGNYVIGMRERLNPPDSWNNIQAMENAIIGWYRKHAGRRNPQSQNNCRRGIRPDRMPGGLGAFRYAWDNCVQTGVLKTRERGQRGYKYSL